MTSDLKDAPLRVLDALFTLVQWSLADGQRVDEGGSFINAEGMSKEGIEYGDWTFTLKRTKKP